MQQTREHLRNIIAHQKVLASHIEYALRCTEQIEQHVQEEKR